MIQDTHGRIRFNNVKMIQLMETVDHGKNEFHLHLDGVLKAMKVTGDFKNCLHYMFIWNSILEIELLSKKLRVLRGSTTISKSFTES